MTSEDVRSVTFEQTRKGYRIEDVDDFLQQVANEMDRIEADRDKAYADRDQAYADRDKTIADREPLMVELQDAHAAKEDVEGKLYVLAAKVEEYRSQEETLKTALINAQRMGETVVHEAKQKADQMLREATGASELLRQKAEQDAEKERGMLEGMVTEVNRFKSTILNLYKQHIESLSALDPPVARAEEVLKDQPGEKADAGPSKVEPPKPEPPVEAQITAAKAEPEIPPATMPVAEPMPVVEPIEESAPEPPAVESVPVSSPPETKKPPAMFGGELIDD